MRTFAELFRNKKIGFTIFVAISLIMGASFYYLGMNRVMPQSSIYFLDNVVLPEANQKVLIVSPHPDDETIATGGYIAMSRERGAEVGIVLVTDGNKHGLRDKRYLEFKKSTSILGVPESDLMFLNYPDGGLVNIKESELQANLKREIDQFKPNIIIYPNPSDSHSDHATAGLVVSKILTNSKDIIPYQYLVHHKNFPQPKLYRKNMYLLPPLDAVKFDNEWLRLILPENIENKKIEAVNSYKTQIRVPFLKGLIMSSIRKNELFSKGN